MSSKKTYSVCFGTRHDEGTHERFFGGLMDKSASVAKNLFNSPRPDDHPTHVEGQNLFNSAPQEKPTYASLGFDPNGPEEWEVRLSHPFATIPALVTGGIARFLDQPDNYTGNFHNDAADAYRHA